MPAKEKNPALKRFGTNVRALREKRELSQEELAEIADLDRTYVGGLERGERGEKRSGAVVRQGVSWVQFRRPKQMRLKVRGLTGVIPLFFRARFQTPSDYDL